MGFNIPALILVALLLILAAFGVGNRKGHEAEALKAKVAMDAHLKADSDAATKAIQEAADATNDLTIAANIAAEKAYREGYTNAERKGTAVTADLRSGNLRLRNAWTGCEAKRLPHAASVAADTGDEARDREDGAGRLVRAGAQCDAQVIGLQDTYNAAKQSIDKFNDKQRSGSSRR